MPPLPPVIYEDDCLIAFDKPSGLPIVPDPRDRKRGSLMESAAGRYGAGLANVHRIDTEASGLVVCAKTKPALDFLSGQFQAKTVENIQEAIVIGAPAFAKATAGTALAKASAVAGAMADKPEGAAPSGGAPTAGPGGEVFTVELYLKEDEAAPGKMCVVKKHGLAAATEFRVLAGFGRFTHLECRPLTGRKHQIRVQLAAQGTPVLNDALYGNDTRLLLSEFKRGYKGRDEERPLIERLALHASRLQLIHPVTREPLVLTAPRPKDLSVALKYLGKYTH